MSNVQNHLFKKLKNLLKKEKSTEPKIGTFRQQSDCTKKNDASLNKQDNLTEEHFNYSSQNENFAFHDQNSSSVHTDNSNVKNEKKNKKPSFVKTKFKLIRNKKRELFILSLFAVQIGAAMLAFSSFNSWQEQSILNKQSSVIDNQKKILASLFYFENKIQNLHVKAIETMYSNTLPALFNEQQEIQTQFLKWKLSVQPFLNNSNQLNITQFAPSTSISNTATDESFKNKSTTLSNAKNDNPSDSKWFNNFLYKVNSTIEHQLIDSKSSNQPIKNNNDKIIAAIASLEQSLLSLESASTSDNLTPTATARYAILENSVQSATELLLGLLSNNYLKNELTANNENLASNLDAVVALNNLQKSHHQLHTKILVNLFRERHSDNKAPPLFLPNVGQPLPILGSKNAPSPIPNAQERRQIEEKLSLQESHSAPLSAQQQYEILQQHLLLNQQYQKTKLLLNTSKTPPESFNIDEIIKSGPFFALQKTLDELLQLESANERLKFIQQFNPKTANFYKSLNSQKETLLFQQNATTNSTLPFLFNFILSLSLLSMIAIFMLKKWIKQNTESALIQKMLSAFYNQIHPYFSANVSSTILLHKNKQTPGTVFKNNSFLKNSQHISNTSKQHNTIANINENISTLELSQKITPEIFKSTESARENHGSLIAHVPQTEQVALMPACEQLFALDALVYTSIQQKARLFESWEQQLSLSNSNLGQVSEPKFNLSPQSNDLEKNNAHIPNHQIYIKFHEQALHAQKQLPLLLQQQESLIPQIGNSMLLLQNVQTASQQLFDQFEHKMQSINKWQHSIKDQTEKTIPITKILLTHNSLFLQESAKLVHLANKIHQISTLLFSEAAPKPVNQEQVLSRNTSLIDSTTSAALPNTIKIQNNGDFNTYNDASRRKLLIHLQSFVNTLSEIIGKQSAQCIQQQEQLRSLLTSSQNLYQVSNVGTALSSYSNTLQKKFVEQQTLCATVNNSMQQFFQHFANQNTQTQELIASLTNPLENLIITSDTSTAEYQADDFDEQIDEKFDGAAIDKFAIQINKNILLNEELLNPPKCSNSFEFKEPLLDDAQPQKV